MAADSIAPSTAEQRRGLRLPLLVGLVASAAVALFVQPRVVSEVREGALEPNALLIAPVLFVFVVLLAALDAWRNARRSGFFHGRSVMLVIAAAAFVGVLVPQTFVEYRTRTAPAATSDAHYAVLARSKDARVRALVMEVAGLRPVPHAEVAALLAGGLDDADPLVVEAARAAVSARMGGEPLAREAARQAVQSWR